MEENVSRCWLTAHWLWGEEKKCTWEKKSSVSRGRGAEGVAAGEVYGMEYIPGSLRILDASGRTVTMATRLT